MWDFIVKVLLSAPVERVSVSRIRNFVLPNDVHANIHKPTKKGLAQKYYWAAHIFC